MRLSIGQESVVLPAFSSPDGARSIKVKALKRRCVQELNLIPVIAVGRGKPLARLRGTAFRAHAKDLLLNILSVHTSRETDLQKKKLCGIPCRLTWCGTPSAEAERRRLVPDDRLKRMAICIRCRDEVVSGHTWH